MDPIDNLQAEILAAARMHGQYEATSVIAIRACKALVADGWLERIGRSHVYRLVSGGDAA